jgi:hypothetical protein
MATAKQRRETAKRRAAAKKGAATRKKNLAAKKRKRPATPAPAPAPHLAPATPPKPHHLPKPIHFSDPKPEPEVETVKEPWRKRHPELARFGAIAAVVLFALWGLSGFPPFSHSSSSSLNERAVAAMEKMANSVPNKGNVVPGGQQTTSAASISKNPCDDGYQYYPSSNECKEKHEPKFVQKAKCTPGEKIRVPDPTSNKPGAFRELTCGYVKNAGN